MSTLTFTNDANFTAVSGCTVASGSVTQNTQYSNDCSSLTDFSTVRSDAGTVSATANPGAITLTCNTTNAGDYLDALGVQLGYALSGDFDTTIQFAHNADQNYEGPQILYAIDSTHYIKCKWCYVNGTMMAFLIHANGSNESDPDASISFSGAHFFRVTRSGNSFSYYIKANSGDSWTTVGSVTVALATGGYLQLCAGTQNTAGNLVVQYQDVVFSSGLYIPAVFTVHDSGVACIDAGSGNGLDLSTLVKMHTSGATISAEYYASDNPSDTPSYTSYTWAQLLALASNDLRYTWLRLTMTNPGSAASFDELTVDTYSADSTPPADPTTTKFCVFEENNFALIWTQPADADFSHCELRKIVGETTYYLGNNAGLATWQTSPSTYWKLREGTGAAGITPASDYIDESVSGTPSYSVRSVDQLGNKSAWVSFSAGSVSADFPDVGNVRDTDTVNGVQGTLSSDKILSTNTTGSGAGNYIPPSAANVRPIEFGVGETGTLANLAAADAAYIALEESRNNANGTTAEKIISPATVKIRNVTITGNASGASDPDTVISNAGGNWITTNITPGNMRDGVTAGLASSPITGNIKLTTADKLLVGTGIGSNGTEVQGSFDEAARNTNPGITFVARPEDGGPISYKIAGQTFVGTLNLYNLVRAFEAGRNDAVDLTKFLDTYSFLQFGVTKTGRYHAPDRNAYLTGNTFGVDNATEGLATIPPAGSTWNGASPYGKAGALTTPTRRDANPIHVELNYEYGDPNNPLIGELIAGGGGSEPSVIEFTIDEESESISVTISGADDLTTNKIYAMAIPLGTSFVEIASITGNGTSTVTLTQGKYWVYGKSTNSSGLSSFSAFDRKTILGDGSVVASDNIAAALKVLKQTAVYWPSSTGFDEYGKPICATPVEIKVRWDNTEEEFVDSQGTRRKATIKVISDRDLDVGGCLFLGILDDLTSLNDPKSNAHVYEIRSTTKIADKKAKRFIRTAYL